MRRYGLLHPLALSFYSQPLYQDVGKNWKGAAFLYLLLVLALCSLPGVVQMQVGLADFVQKDAAGLIQQIPRISISDGEVSTDVETPYYITDPKTHKPLIIIDLTGRFTSLEGTEAKVLLTKKQVIAKKSDQETRVYDLSGVKKFSIDRATIERWLQLARSWITLLLFPLVLLFSYCYRVFQVFIYGLIGLIFAKISHASLDFMASVRLSIIAITPVLVLDTVLDLAKVHVPSWWLICFLIAMGYLFFGIKANAVAQPQAGTPGPQPRLT